MTQLPIDKIDLELIQQFGNLELIAKYVVEGFITGLHKSPFHGFSVEFAENRLYNTGESTRHIDWKLYARTDKLFVKKFEEETNLRCMILIDNSSSMYFPDQKYNKLQFSIYGAAALTHLLRKQRDAVGLTLFSEDIEKYINPRSSHAHIQGLYNILSEQLKNNTRNKKTSTAKVLHNIAEAIHKRSLVVIFSDMLDNIDDEDAVFSALQHLKYNKHEIILFHVVDRQKELELTYPNRPYKFIDLETQESINIYPDQVKDEYIKQVEAYREKLKIRALQYNIDFVEADINKGFYSVMQSFFIKRSRLY
jgi:uncharacterized protein (DUF58 family)